ncbi:MAG TPA: VOC family protein [Bryobacteraceae bacterium]|jgi:methylmalonyl-CoA/ethylmalonyl-CoA epimerase|nr:VOC family protein [Bryobacteraceae bacterium]
MEATLLGKLHHVGFVVRSIEESLGGFLHSLDSHAATGVIHDPLQQVNVLFLRTGSAESMIELVEPAGEKSPVRRFLEKGGGLNHLCYEVADIEGALERMKLRAATIVSRPKPAAAFNGRPVAWAVTKEWLLIELLQAER